MEKIPGVIKGRFYVTTSLSDSSEAFTPLHAGVTLRRFFTPVGSSVLYSHIYGVHYIWEAFTLVDVLT